MKVIGNIISANYNLSAKANFNEEIKHAQAPNQDSQEDNSTSKTNSTLRGIREPTASIEGSLKKRPLEMRSRSRRSTVSSDSKGDNVIKSKGISKILEPKPKAVAHKVINDLLSTYLAKGKYNGIIRIIDSTFLKGCYSLIKSNPGNMTKGTSDETLDKINDK